MNRSENMRAIRSEGMRPELAVRSLVHKMGYRFRLHGKNLPGKPDLVFASRRKVIFVHGCFWHCHNGCKAAHTPKSNLSYWEPKLSRNRSRDAMNVELLADSGWKSLIIWECETKDDAGVRKRIASFLSK